MFARLTEILPPDGDLLLLEVATILLVHEHQVQVVLDAELVVDVAVRRRELPVDAREEQAHGDTLPPHRRAVHDLELDHGLRFVEEIGAGASRLTADHGQLHVLYLDPHEQEVNLADDDVVQVVLGGTNKV